MKLFLLAVSAASLAAAITLPKDADLLDDKSYAESSSVIETHSSSDEAGELLVGGSTLGPKLPRLPRSPVAQVVDWTAVGDAGEGKPEESGVPAGKNGNAKKGPPVIGSPAGGSEGGVPAGAGHSKEVPPVIGSPRSKSKGGELDGSSGHAVNGPPLPGSSSGGPPITGGPPINPPNKGKKMCIPCFHSTCCSHGCTPRCADGVCIPDCEHALPGNLPP